MDKLENNITITPEQKEETGKLVKGLIGKIGTALLAFLGSLLGVLLGD